MKSEISYVTVLLILAVCASIRGIALADTLPRDNSAQYLVPPSRPGSAPAVYPLSETGFEVIGKGERLLKIRLPEDLIGVEIETLTLVEVKPGSQGLALFSDGQVTAVCMDTASGSNCLMKYPAGYGVKEYVLSAESFLKSKFNEMPDVLKLKLEESRRFLSDPEGVVMILRSPRSGSSG